MTVNNLYFPEREKLARQKEKLTNEKITDSQNCKLTHNAQLKT